MRTVLCFLLCFGLVACGTKPKDLKGPQPFPASYPQAGAQPTPAQNPPPENPTPDK